MADADVNSIELPTFGRIPYQCFAQALMPVFLLGFLLPLKDLATGVT
jgi:hypothetical protein